jgi:hypothetical protein
MGGKRINTYQSVSLSSADADRVDEVGNGDHRETRAPYGRNEEFLTRISEATSICLKPVWIKPNGMALNAARLQWGGITRRCLRTSRLEKGW